MAKDQTQKNAIFTEKDDDDDGGKWKTFFSVYKEKDEKSSVIHSRIFFPLFFSQLYAQSKEGILCWECAQFWFSIFKKINSYHKQEADFSSVCKPVVTTIAHIHKVFIESAWH